ncbi:xanthine dehydrogenase accessory protein XdhC [Pleomorphomonas diazotrophica]|uniref:Xanthine dehydrogenase accessory protein XdhC n=1 Tax=Pleomorphomonas diazotrophica TaxID=1166257 RepID=A0A1I4UBN4_9HYPH|nr:xanthine dehydrogenase accessory protein XdhC [Pleomorphomonas diazotrophica]PKR91296.1 xanthine dehydrogenase accessory protein XdhC [Pleomorphomonas diazotrophica]SFM86113.1 molybdenum cofactor sulfurylase [Pleomorphomonas diazotrophica]
MREVFAPLHRYLARDGVAALVTVVGAKGSTPREAGARMVVSVGGTISGTIGGGRLELEAMERAIAALRERRDASERLDLALGPSIGQCCGGAVSVMLETFTSARLDAVAKLAAAEGAGPFQTAAVSIDGAPIERRIVGVERLGPAAALDANGRLDESFGEPLRDLLLFGAGHVGRALVLALAPLPFRIRWIDSRPSAFPDLPLARLEQVVAAAPQSELKTAPSDAFVLIMTHDHGLDLDILHAALSEDRFPYVGLIGSRTKRARFEHRLAELGHSESRIRAFTCPIGVPGITSKEPAHIAISVVAELLIVDEKIRRTPVGEFAAGQTAGSSEIGQTAQLFGHSG